MVPESDSMIFSCYISKSLELIPLKKLLTCLKRLCLVFQIYNTILLFSKKEKSITIHKLSCWASNLTHLETFFSSVNIEDNIKIFI